MANPGDKLREIWDVSDTKVIAGGDSAIINDWLANKLDKIKVDWSGWLTLYRHRDSGQFWELTYPMGELHGGRTKVTLLFRHCRSQ
jgi:hypothetical protein